MRNILFVWVAIIICTLYTSCSDDIEPDYIPDASIEAENTELIMGESASCILRFTSSIDWTISLDNASDSAWCKISADNGKAGTISVTFTALSNDTFEDRKAGYTIQSGDKEVKGTIFQEWGNGITDIRFKDYVFHNYCLENFDSDGNGQISFEEIKNVTDLVVRGTFVVAYSTSVNDISQRQSYVDMNSLEGIAYFKSLKTLDCSHQIELKTLDLSRNKALEELRCSQAGIRILDLTGLTELKLLLCEDMFYLTELIFKENVNLQSLKYGGNNKVTSLDLSGLEKLETLNYHYTTLTSLDVSKCSNLKTLWCAYNGYLTNVTLGNNPSLEDLTFAYGILSELDVSGAPNLKKLLVAENKNLSEINLGENQYLEWLICPDNNLVSLDLSMCPNLNRIEVFNNPDLSELWLNKDFDETSISIEKDDHTIIKKK